MYKDHFRRIGIQKNLKPGDAQTIVRTKAARDAAGKISEFFLSGKRVSYVRARRHLDRKGSHWQLNRDSGNRRESGTGTGLTRKIQVVTPPPTIRPPDAIAVLQEILWSLREYIDGSFANGTWVLEKATGLVLNARPGAADCKHNMDHFQGFFKNGSSELLTGDAALGSRRLNLAFGTLREILRYETPELLPRVLLSILDLQETSGLDRSSRLIRMLWDYIQPLTSIVLGASHPLSRILRSIGTAITPPQQLSLMELTVDFMTEQLERQLGSVTAEVIWTSLYAADIQRRNPNRRGADSVMSTMRKLLARLAPGQVESEIILRRSLAITLERHGKNQEAKIELQAILSLPGISNTVRYNSLWMLGCLERDLGNLEQSIQAFEEGLVMAEEPWGLPASRAERIQRILDDLLPVLRDFGDEGRYNELCEKRKSCLSFAEADMSVEMASGQDAAPQPTEF